MKKVLVIQTAFLGDVILATPLIEKICYSFPKAEISMLVREGNEGLLINHPYLTEVLIWRKQKGKWIQFEPTESQMSVMQKMIDDKIANWEYEREEIDAIDCEYEYCGVSKKDFY